MYQGVAVLLARGFYLTFPVISQNGNSSHKEDEFTAKFHFGFS